MATVLQTFVALRRREREWTRRLVAAIPADRLDWRPAPESFGLGDLVRHLVQAERFWATVIAESAAGRSWDPFGLEGTGRERLAAFAERNVAASRTPKLGATLPELLAAWDEIATKADADLAGIAAEDLDREVIHPLTRVRVTVAEMLFLMISHEVHHRGQISAYLKVLGVEQPPIYVD